MIKTILVHSLVNRLFLSMAVILCMYPGHGYAQNNNLHTVRIRNSKDLRGYFAYTGHDIPLISGHRGGTTTGYPENCIATFENTLRYTPAFFEIDPRLTKDSVVVLMHDATLERTTTGTGKVSDYTWAELKKFKLKDPAGNVTPYGIPTLDEVIVWSKGKTVINLDKKDVPLEMTAAKLAKHNAWAHVMLTVHDARQAKFYYTKNNNAMFSAFVQTKKALEDYEKEGVPWSHMIAYIGPTNKPENRELFDLLHARGVMCMISAAPSYDKLANAGARATAYRETIQSGADIIESDLPIEAAAAIRSLVPVNRPKQKYFTKVAATVNAPGELDKQAHRGGRGLMPENTIPAMKNALDLGTTLEMDLYLSKDKKLVVSHDNRLSTIFVLDADGHELDKTGGKTPALTALNYEDIKKFDVGSKPNPDFPRKKNVQAYIPLFTELVDSVEAYARSRKLNLPRYNVEAKMPARDDLPDSGYRHQLIREMVRVIKDKKIQQRVIIQSFDVEALEILHREFPAIPASYLISKNGLDENLAKLSFIPAAYSPVYTIIDNALVDACHQKGMKVIAWTPNTKEDIERLKAMGVDAIITDYPDLF